MGRGRQERGKGKYSQPDTYYKEKRVLETPEVVIDARPKRKLEVPEIVIDAREKKKKRSKYRKVD